MLSLSLCRCFTGVVQAKRSPKVVVSNVLSLLSPFSLAYFTPVLCPVHFYFSECYYCLAIISETPAVIMRIIKPVETNIFRD